MLNFMPKTNLGRESLIFFLLTLIFFLLSNLAARTLYKSLISGKNILEDIFRRPFIDITMIGGFLSGILTFIFGFVAIFKQKEHSLLVYLAVVIEAFFIFFLFSEVFTLH